MKNLQRIDFTWEYAIHKLLIKLPVINVGSHIELGEVSKEPFVNHFMNNFIMLTLIQVKAAIFIRLMVKYVLLNFEVIEI